MKKNELSTLSQIWLFLLQSQLNVRVVADIPHPRYKIQVFLYNAKYMVKIELGQFEQTFKIAEADVAGLEDIKRMVTDELLQHSLERFLTMRSDWENAFKQKDWYEKLDVSRLDRAFDDSSSYELFGR